MDKQVTLKLHDLQLDEDFRNGMELQHRQVSPEEMRKFEGYMAEIFATFGMDLSMHSNSHLGISLAAMTHLAAATPNVTYACDTHWPWKDPAEDVIKPGALAFENGSVAVPTTPGLGVELDRDALARDRERYERCGYRKRDDAAEMCRVVDPTWKRLLPTW
jgi:glucarate dehydratase